MAPSEPETCVSTSSTTPSLKEVRVIAFTVISPFRVPPMVSLFPLIRSSSDCTMDISHRLAKPTPQLDNALPPKKILVFDPMVTFPVPLFMLPAKFKVLPVSEISPPFEVKFAMTRSPFASKMMSPPCVRISSFPSRNRIAPLAEVIFALLSLLIEFFNVLNVTVLSLPCCKLRRLSAKFPTMISLSA